MLINEEANAIGTAWLRLDLLPADAQPELRELFRQYLDSRLLTYKKIPDIPAVEAELANSTRIQGEIWRRAVAAVKTGPPGPSGTAVLTALNAMFDIMTTRTMAARTHPPPIIYVDAGGAGAGGVALRRRRDGRREEPEAGSTSLGFAIVMSLTVYVILDLEFPRVGFIRLDATDRVLVELRESMK